MCYNIKALERVVGVDDNEGTPVPIPNTEVKLIGAEDTWLVAARENRKMPTQKRLCDESCEVFFSLQNLKKTMTSRKGHSLSFLCKDQKYHRFWY